MGTGYGLKFDANNNTSHVPLMTMSENGVVVSDSNGNLLFYSNGRIIKDRNHNIMPNSYIINASDYNRFGAGGINNLYGVLRSDHTNMQVIQMDKSVPRYLFFYIKSNYTDINEFFNLNTSLYYELRYSVIDMRLNNGMGDIDPNYKNILIGRQFYPALCIIPNGKCNAWLVTANKEENNFFSYPIMNDETIGQPIKSNSQYLDLIGLYTRNQLTNSESNLINLIASNKGNYITSADIFGKNEILHFDKVSGKLNHLIGFYDVSRPSNVESDYQFRFSPNETKVYAFDKFGNLSQYNTSFIMDSLAFVSSKVKLDVMSLSLDPYKIAHTFGELARSFQYLPGLRVRNEEMYNVVQVIYKDSLTQNPVSGSSYYYKIINPDSVLVDSNLKYVDTTNFNHSYYTSTSQTDSISGNFHGRTYRNSDFQREITNIGRDMVIFQPNSDLDTVVTLDTVICGDVNMTLTTRYADATNIRWSTGSTDSSINIDATGRYTVTVTYPHCTFTEVFWVRSPLAGISLSVTDTLMCTERPFVVYVNREGVGGRAVWQNGLVGDSMIINKGGTYHVTIQTDCGSVSDTLHVQEMSCRCSYFVPNAFTSNGDGLNDLLIVHIDCIPLEFQMHIYNRYGQLVNKLEKYGEHWDGTFINKEPAAGGVYFYRMRYKDLAGDYQTVTGDVTLIR